MALARILVALVAILACAWFATGIRQAHDTAAATAILAKTPHAGSPGAARAAELLRTAKTLNPDRAVDVLRARLLIDEHQRAEARRILQGVIRREPMNIEAWVYLAEAAFPADMRTVEVAGRKIRELDPRAR